MKKIVGEVDAVQTEGKDPGIWELEVTFKISCLCSFLQWASRQLIKWSPTSAIWMPSVVESSLHTKAFCFAFGQTHWGCSFTLFPCPVPLPWSMGPLACSLCTATLQRLMNVPVHPLGEHRRMSTWGPGWHSLAVLIQAMLFRINPVWRSPLKNPKWSWWVVLSGTSP